MNKTEALMLQRTITALCPTQTFDVMSLEAWSMAMDDIPYEDAREAVRIVFRDQGRDDQYGPRKIEPDAIFRQVKRIRAKRIADYGEVIPPFGLTPVADKEYRRQAYKKIGDGEVLPETRGELKPRPDIGILAGRSMRDDV